MVHDRRVEGRDIKDRAGVFATLLVVIVLSLVVCLVLRLMLSSRSRVRASLFRLLSTMRGLVVVNWNWVGFRDGHRDLLVHFDNLSDWHGHVFDHMHRIGDRVWHLYWVGNGHFHGNRFRDTDLLGRKVVLADECAEVLEL